MREENLGLGFVLGFLFVRIGARHATYGKEELQYLSRACKLVCLSLVSRLFCLLLSVSDLKWFHWEYIKTLVPLGIRSL